MINGVKNFFQKTFGSFKKSRTFAMLTQGQHLLKVAR